MGSLTAPCKHRSGHGYSKFEENIAPGVGEIINEVHKKPGIQDSLLKLVAIHVSPSYMYISLPKVQFVLCIVLYCVSAMSFNQGLSSCWPPVSRGPV